ncbi:MAG: ribosome maturation factor RimP [Oscillospiraceae bacterium]|nr:ribosome maturation factor RimP [Candidatus Limimonas coprohippi]MCQ2487941.1 ribosome maturation factor RimP [Clostridia bacterium]
MAGKVETTVREIVEPFAKELGLSIWDVEFVKEGADHYLRIYIDKENGISIDDCVNLSHAVDEPLDAADPIDCSYCLEVSSPGVERTLKNDEHFMAYIDKKVMIKLIRPVDGEREFKGILKDYDKGNVTFESNEGKTLVFNKKEASFVKADDFEM